MALAPPAAWISTYHCRSGRHCRTCRDLARGRKFRASMCAKFAGPPGAPDFDCPHGLPWGWMDESPAARRQSPGQPAQRRRAAELRPRVSDAMYAERYRLCLACPQVRQEKGRPACRVLGKSGCGFTAFLHKPASSCPADPPRWAAQGDLPSASASA